MQRRCPGALICISLRTNEAIIPSRVSNRSQTQTRRRGRDLSIYSAGSSSLLCSWAQDEIQGRAVIQETRLSSGLTWPGCHGAPGSVRRGWPLLRNSLLITVSQGPGLQPREPDVTGLHGLMQNVNKHKCAIRRNNKLLLEHTHHKRSIPRSGKGRSGTQVRS